MKRLVVLSAVFCLLSIAALGQAKPADYSGEWSLDKAKSTLPDRMKSIESMTMTVTQTDKDIKIATATKRGAPPQGAGGPPPGGGTGGAPGAGGPPPGGGGRGGGMGMGDQTLTYTLDGKETSADIPGPGGTTSPVKLTAKAGAGKLELTNSRTISSQMGEFKITTRETWELQSDGSLKVKRDTETTQGTTSADLVFTKKAK